MDTSFFRVAGIGRTCILIVAIEGLRGDACSIDASRCAGAGIAVIAGPVIGCEDTVATVTRLVSAWVAIVAGQSGAARASAIDTAVIHRAGIPVIAGSLDGLVGAASLGQADILGAGVVVITRQVAYASAVAFHAAIAGRTRVFIITVVGVRREYTSEFTVAAIICAWIPVITGRLVTRGASTLGANIPLRATIAIVAGLCVVGVGASGCDIAAIGGA